MKDANFANINKTIINIYNLNEFIINEMSKYNENIIHLYGSEQLFVLSLGLNKQYFECKEDTYIYKKTNFSIGKLEIISDTFCENIKKYLSKFFIKDISEDTIDQPHFNADTIDQPHFNADTSEDIFTFKNTIDHPHFNIQNSIKDICARSRKLCDQVNNISIYNNYKYNTQIILWTNQYNYKISINNIKIFLNNKMIFLCARNDNNSFFYKDYFPLDIFKIIYNLTFNLELNHFF